jgi:hypothetical protein
LFDYNIFLPIPHTSLYSRKREIGKREEGRGNREEGRGKR